MLLCPSVPWCFPVREPLFEERQQQQQQQQEEEEQQQQFQEKVAKIVFLHWLQKLR